jgi:hypothetical protein
LRACLGLGVWRFGGEGTGEFSARFDARPAFSFRNGDAPRVPWLTLFDALLGHDMTTLSAAAERQQRGMTRPSSAPACVPRLPGRRAPAA